MKAIRSVNMPFPCKECLQEVFDIVRSDERATQVAHHCPHHDVLIHAQVDDMDGERIISQWIVQGPLPQREAVKVIKGLGVTLGQPMQLQTKGVAH